MDFWQQFELILNDTRVQLLIPVLVGTIHGYFAAWLAVRMLFRPRRPLKILGITIFPQGMIPRNRARLAKAIGKAVGDELVSQETVLEELFEKDFLRNKIESVVNSYSEDILTKSYPSLLDVIPDEIRKPFNESLQIIQSRLSSYIRSTLESEETLVAINRFISERMDALLSTTVAEATTSQQYQDLFEFFIEKLEHSVHDPKIDTAIYTFVSDRVDDLARTEQPLSSMFTPEIILLLKEKAIEQIDPIVHQLSELATEDRTKEQISSLIKNEVHAYYNSLPFVKKIFVSRDKLLNEVDELVNESLPKRIEETLQGDFFAEESKRFITNSIDNVISKPISELMAQVAPNQLTRLKAQISDTLLRLIRSKQMQSSTIKYFSSSIENLGDKKLSEIADSFSPMATIRLKEALVTGIEQLLKNDETNRIINLLVTTQIDKLIHAPIGRLSNHLPEERVTEFSNRLTDAIMSAARKKLPEAIQEFDIGGVVREKVNNYPVEKLESLVLSVAKEHLRTIELFGAFFGLLIGLIQALINYFLYNN